MKKVILFAAFILALASCSGPATQVQVSDSTKADTACVIKCDSMKCDSVKVDTVKAK